MNNETCSYIELAFGGDAAFVVTDYFFDVGQAQTETFNVMNVAAGGTIKAFKYFFEVLFFDADAIVPDSYNQVILEFSALDFQYQWSFATVLQGIVQQIEQHVGQMHFIGNDQGFHFGNILTNLSDRKSVV